MDDDDVVDDFPTEVQPRIVPALPAKFFTRRRFIGMAGGAAAGASAWDHDMLRIASVGDVLANLRTLLNTRLREIIGNVGGGVALPTRTLTFELKRREDMLRLTFDLYNLQPSGSDGNTLVKRTSSAPAYAVVTFPSQHIAEQALNRPDNPSDQEFFPSNGLAKARMSGPSRLVFRIPDNRIPVPRTVAGLLNWSDWEPRLVPAAVAPDKTTGGTLRAPALNTTNNPAETALELPWRLILSPLPGSAWAHKPGVAEAAGVYELWHTRLANKSQGDADEHSAQRHVRAVWSLDPGKPPTGPVPPTDDLPFRTSLRARHRVQIVKNSASYAGGGTAAPIGVNRLMLSSLGGFLDVEANWQDPQTDLAIWQHRAALGRDSYAKAVEYGFLMPWGFPAVKITTTERVVENRVYDGAADGRLNVAFLRQKEFLIVQNPLVRLDQSSVDGRDMAFRSVRVHTLVTPAVVFDVNNLVADAEVPMVAGEPFKFALEAFDWEGRAVKFGGPMAFVPRSKAVPDNVFGDVFIDNRTPLRRNWNNAPDVMRTVDIRGQRVAFTAPTTPGDTTAETYAMTIGVAAPKQAVAAEQPMFRAVLDRASIRVEAAEAISGAALGGTEVRYPEFFLKDGYTGNTAQTFLEIAEPVGLDFGAATDAAGGVAAPSMSLTGISRKKGAIGGTLEEQRAGTFNPASVFGTLDANLIGGLKLTDVIVSGGGLGEAIDLKSTEVPGGRMIQMRWTPKLKADPAGILKPKRGSTDGKFILDAVVTAKSDGTTTQDIRGDLRDVTLQLLGNGALHFIDVEVRKLIFTSRTGTSPHVDVSLGEVTFAGPLTFINELREVLANPDGPAGVEVSGSGIVARASLAIPSIGVGIFNLSNLAFNSKIGIPFDNTPVYAEFGISSKQDPFLVAVSVFGGGGWFGLTIDAEGIQAIEAGFEFGAVLALDFGVAGGSLEVMAGIYFRLESLDGGGSKITLTGYVRIQGEVYVGFVSVGLSAELSLTYTDKNGKAIISGRAVVTLELPVAPDVTFEIERSFGGDPHDPRYVDQVTSQEWRNYLNAFADEPLLVANPGGQS